VEEVDLAVEVDEVAHDLEHAGADRAERFGDADELIGLGGQRRRRLAQARLVVERAARGESECARLDRFACQIRHLGDVVGRGRLLRRAAFPHHVQAECTVGHLCTQVDVPRLAIEVVEVLGETGPLPRQPFVERRARDVLDSFHQLDQPLPVLWQDRREADAAVAHHHGRDPVPARRSELGVPRRLTVVVGVDVDESRGDEVTVGVDLACAAAIGLPDCRDHAAGHRDIADELIGTCPVDDGAVPDDELVFGHDAPFPPR